MHIRQWFPSCVSPDFTCFSNSRIRTFSACTIMAWLEWLPLDPRLDIPTSSPPFESSSDSPPLLWMIKNKYRKAPSYRNSHLLNSVRFVFLSKASRVWRFRWTLVTSCYETWLDIWFCVLSLAVGWGIVTIHHNLQWIIFLIFSSSWIRCHVKGYIGMKTRENLRKHICIHFVNRQCPIQIAPYKYILCNARYYGPSNKRRFGGQEVINGLIHLACPLQIPQ